MEPLAFESMLCYTQLVSAGVMELVDVVDSKSTAGDSVPVRVRSPAPSKADSIDAVGFQPTASTVSGDLALKNRQVW